MTIEFADPGFNWAFVWCPVAITVILIVAFIIAGIATDWDEYSLALSITGPPMMIALMGTALFSLVGGVDYGNRVDDLITLQISEQGFSNVEVSGDRFTAATSDGEYFSGYLIDLEPETGYAYRIVELED